MRFNNLKCNPIQLSIPTIKCRRRLREYIFVDKIFQSLAAVQEAVERIVLEININVENAAHNKQNKLQFYVVFTTI